MKNQNVIGKSITSDLFQWQVEEKCFVQEISTLGRGWTFGQLYADACDLGFVMVSARTSKAMPFVHSSTDYDANGEDVAGWRFKAVDGSCTALIIND